MVLARRLAPLLLVLGLLAACQAPPDRVGPEQVRLETDDLARTVLEAAGEALGIPGDEVRGTGDARRCDDRSAARHQVDATLRAGTTNPGARVDDLAAALGDAGLDARVTQDGDDPVVAGRVGPLSWEVVVGSDAQVVTVQSQCQDVGRLQAVEISFESRYPVRPGEESPPNRAGGGR